MTGTFKKLGLALLPLCLSALIVVSISTLAEGKKKSHPYDVYDHGMHTGFFKSVDEVTCDTCHADPISYVDRKKVNPMGCHFCHKRKEAQLPGPSTCTLCHEGGPPKPQSHKVAWDKKHQVYAKQNAKECQQCHTNQMFCIDCHKRRDTVQERMHRRNFKFFHSIEARANPRRCDACHTVAFCQKCHAGRGTTKR